MSHQVETLKPCNCRMNEICAVCNPEEFKAAVESSVVLRTLAIQGQAKRVNTPDRRCCELDTDNDGNCPVHQSPGELRTLPVQKDKFITNQ
jgi:hypothetical protein